MPAKFRLQRFFALSALACAAPFCGSEAAAQDWDLSNSSRAVIPYLQQAQNRAAAGSTNPRDSYNDYNQGFDQATKIENNSPYNPISFFPPRTNQPPHQDPYLAPAANSGWSEWSESTYSSGANLFAPKRTHFQLGVEGVALARSAPTGGAFVFDDNGTALSYTDLGLGLDVGIRYTGRFFADNESGLEFVYLSLDSSMNQTVAGPNVLPVVFNGTPADPQPSYDIQYDSSLSSYELNFWLHSTNSWRFGIGYRQFELAEQFNVIQTFDPTLGFFSDTTNQLKGIQLLIEKRHDLSELIQFFAVGKLGFMQNDVQIDAFASNAEVHALGDTSSFVADINTGLRFTMTEYAQLSIGYQALLFTNIAVAPEQSQQFSLFDPAVGSTQYGNAPFHGFSFGATVAY